MICRVIQAVLLSEIRYLLRICWVLLALFLRVDVQESDVLQSDVEILVLIEDMYILRPRQHMYIYMYMYSFGFNLYGQ